jgi:hypothetical protein
MSDRRINPVPEFLEMSCMVVFTVTIFAKDDSAQVTLKDIKDAVYNSSELLLQQICGICL